MPRRRPSHPKRTSKFLGVGSNNRKNLWQARIMYLGKATHLGYYTSEEDAARAYDRWARGWGERPAAAQQRQQAASRCALDMAGLPALAPACCRRAAAARRVAIALHGADAQTNFPASEYAQLDGGAALQVGRLPLAGTGAGPPLLLLLRAALSALGPAPASRLHDAVRLGPAARIGLPAAGCRRAHACSPAWPPPARRCAWRA